MSNRSINLLHKDDFGNTTLGKISVWSLSVGRWIVIITELIVILAFAARFKFDREIADLSDEINQKQVIVKAYEPFEQTFRITQQRLSVLTQALNQQKNNDHLLEVINQSIPDDVFLSNINLEDNQLVIKATALTEQGLAGMHAQLQQAPDFAEVTLTRLAVEDNFTKGIQFEIKAKLKSNLKTES